MPQHTSSAQLQLGLYLNSRPSLMYPSHQPTGQHNGYHEAYSQQHPYVHRPSQQHYQHPAQHHHQLSGPPQAHHAVPSSGASSASSRSSSSAQPKSALSGTASNIKREPSMPALKQHASSKQKADDAVGAKVKRTRNRKPSSCVQCRKKKLRCNRASPCDQCTLKGEQCNWDDAVPLFDARAEHDADELRAQVRRLEALVAHLTSQQESNSNARSSSPGSSASGDRSPGADHVHSPTVVQFPSAGRPALRPSLSSESQQNKTKLDLRANDLCEGIAKLVIKEYCVVDGSGEESWAPNGQRGTPFIEEAASFLANMPQNFGLTSEMPKFAPRGFGGSTSTAIGDQMQSPGPSEASTMSSEPSPGPLGSSSFHRAAPPLSEALKYLPTPKEAMSTYTYYSGYVSWQVSSRGFHLPSFEQQWAKLYEDLKLDDEQRVKQIDPFFVATFLGVCATSLAMMPAKRALRDGFGAQKSKTVDRWLEGAMVALTCGRFLDNPSVDSVRSVTVLCTYFVFMAHGESSGAGMGLLSLAVQVAMSLNLHRDPDRTPGKFTFFEAENRRRLFWSLFTLCILSSASLGRTWAVFDLNHVDCKLPLDCHDHEIFDQETAEAAVASRKRKFEETPMTSLLLRAKLAVMAKKINDKAFGIHPCSYSTVLELDRDLKEFEDSIPSRYQLRLDSVGALVRRSPHVTVTEMRACMLHISICTEFIRIHRPWLVLAGSNELYQFSRDRLIQYAKLMIAIYRSPSCSNHPWGGMTYKAASAAVVLAIDILTFPTGGEVESIRALLKATASQMERWEKESCISRKGARVIRFLLAKEAAIVAQREHRRDQRTGKRARTADYSSFPNHTVRQTLDPLFEDYPLVQAGLPEHPYVADEYDLRRRVPETYVDTPSYAASAVSYESATPAQSDFAEPRVAAPLPKTSTAYAATVPTPVSGVDVHLTPDVYDLNFGMPGSILNEFAFDFAVPSSTFDIDGDLQYQLNSGNATVSLPLDLNSLDTTAGDPNRLDSSSQKSSLHSDFSSNGLLTPVSQAPLPLVNSIAAKHDILHQKPHHMPPTYTSSAAATPASHVYC
ncbi:hypothetical protein OIV83_003014 [Microbotryomycetes sp. JL201]|nr:hypothetical protein OIV83_003014 [Microbotryomycetes sp. JL201]